MRATEFYAGPTDGLPEPVDQECRRPRRVVLANFGLGLHDSFPDQFHQASTPKRPELLSMRIAIVPFGHRHLPTSSRAAARDGWIPRDEKKQLKIPRSGYNKGVERVQTFGGSIPRRTDLSLQVGGERPSSSSPVRENYAFLLESTPPVGRNKVWWSAPVPSASQLRRQFEKGLANSLAFARVNLHPH
jgi:hypothetical protein